MSGDVIELLIYHQLGVKPSLTLHPFGVPGYVAGHSLTPELLDLENKSFMCYCTEFFITGNSVLKSSFFSFFGCNRNHNWLPNMAGP